MEEESQDDLEWDETSQEEVVSESAGAEDSPASRKNGFVRIVFYFLIYVVLGGMAVVCGIAWHYIDANAEYDMSQVRELAEGAKILDRHGELIGFIGASNRRIVSREEVPQHFVDALVAAEDQRFFYHPGFDPIGTIRAALANARADSIQEGASTLTQQLARDVYGLDGRHMERKLNEIAISVWIESEYSKDEILIHYLNRIYFGSGFYGLGAAAYGYFNKEVKDLTLDESALLCGLIRSPSRFSPFVNHEKAIAGRDQTLNRMVSIGRLDAGERDQLLEADTLVANNWKQRIHRGQCAFLLARVERELRGLLGERSLEGLTISCSVDLAMQEATTRAVGDHLGRLRKEHRAAIGQVKLEGAVVLIENDTGKVLVSVGSRDFFASEYDRSRDMKRPSGSAFFPFVYAAAFEGGSLKAHSPVFDAPFDNRGIGLGGIDGVLGEWSTEHPDNRWEGQISAGEALRKSKNSPTARIGVELGLSPVIDLLKRAGVETPVKERASSLLGGSDIALDELVRAYTIFPNRGTACPDLGMIDSVHLGEEALYQRSSSLVAERLLGGGNGRDSKVISPQTAEQIATLIDGEKTGTTSAFTDGWCLGFNEQYTWGIWVGKDSFETVFPMAFGKVLARPIAERMREKHSEWAKWESGADGEALAGAVKERRDRPVMRRRPYVLPDSQGLVGPDPYGVLGVAKQ